jgi:hypothetical protein
MKKMLVVVSVSFFASVSLLLTNQAEAKSLSDHRVKNLSCQSVNSDSVAKAIRPEVYSQANHLPYQNWSFQWGVYQLAGCWSLSRFQRLYFYMHEPKATPSMNEFSDQVRSEEMYDDGREWKGFPLDRFAFMPNQADATWTNWEKGWFETGTNPRALERGLKPDIEYYQALRFHQIDNLKYLRGPLARTVTENNTTWSELSGLIASGRKPLMLLRPAVYTQHVVVAKRIEVTATGAKIWVYDSNSPLIERAVTWDRATAMFSAFEIIDGMAVPDPHAALGVFLVDGDENEKLLDSLAEHYRSVCAAI